jgi:hypothetical protein
MVKQPLAEWQAEMKSRFPSSDAAAFICPACGHVATVKDHKDAGGDENDAPQACIGRTNGKGTKNQKDEGYGCNWAAFGLLKTIGKGRIIVMPEGKEVHVFDFAPAVAESAEEAVASNG